MKSKKKSKRRHKKRKKGYTSTILRKQLRVKEKHMNSQNPYKPSVNKLGGWEFTTNISNNCNYNLFSNKNHLVDQKERTLYKQTKDNAPIRSMLGLMTPTSAHWKSNALNYTQKLSEKENYYPQKIYQEFCPSYELDLKMKPFKNSWKLNSRKLIIKKQRNWDNWAK